MLAPRGASQIPDPGLKDSTILLVWELGSPSLNYNYTSAALQPCFLSRTETASRTRSVMPMFSSATREKVRCVSQTLLEIQEAQSSSSMKATKLEMAESNEHACEV